MVKEILTEMLELREIPKPKKDEYPPYSRIYMDLLKDDGHVLQQCAALCLAGVASLAVRCGTITNG